MKKEFDRIELLKHLIRVNKGEQCLFNRFHVRTEDIRRYNMKCDLIQFDMEKLRIIYDMTDLVKSDSPNEKLLYKLNEGLKILFNKSYKGKSFLYPHVLLVAILDLMIIVCELIDKMEIESTYDSLVDSIENLICRQFLAEYCDGLLQSVKENNV